MEFQQLLIARGILEGEPDGVIGPATLEAVKTYQRSKHLGVDGYPSLTLLKMLRSEAPPTPVGSVTPAQPAAAGEGQPAAAGASPPATGQPAAGQPAAIGEGQPAAVGQE
jgi:peptidoglycan hydrolase-like protein with peptidoglycan-binding domain